MSPVPPEERPGRDDTRCAYAACQCRVSGRGTAYCSDYCRQAALLGSAEASCACGHIGCQSFCTHAPSFYQT